MSGSDELDPCPNCSTSIASNERYCPACTTDIGPPNVRACGKAAEVSEVDRRFDEARQAAAKQKLQTEWELLSEVLQKKSGVVIAVPALFARSFIQNPSDLYNNYNQLVGITRRPASAENDRQRSTVEAMLFGSYGKKICYGTLSIGCDALPSYGDVAFRLRDLTIMKRTSFLDENSYAFTMRHGLSPAGPIPHGYRSTWDNRHKLALAKLGCKIEPNQGEAEWRRLLVAGHASIRAQDDFIEAHIYGAFNVDAVESVTAIGQKKPSHDARLAINLFQQRQALN